MVLRGLLLYGTVLSCPAWLCKAWRFEVWSGMSVWSPVRLGQVVFGSARLSKVRRLMARSGSGGWGTVECGFVWQGKVLLWFGDVLFGVVGFIGVLCSMVRSYCGVVWNRKARQCLVKFCPVKHWVVWLASALLRLGEVVPCMDWSGEVLWSGVWSSALMYGKALLRSGIAMYGTVRSGLARLRAAGQALVRFYFGLVMQGGVLLSTGRHGKVT